MAPPLAAVYKVEAPAATVSEVNVRTFGQTAIIVAKVTFETKSSDAKNPVHALRESFVAHWTSDGWKLASAQYTVIQDKH